MARYFAEKTPFYYEFTMEDEPYPMICYFTSGDELFVEVAKRYAFNDCEPIRIERIICNNAPAFYNGWAPGMYYSFSDEQGEVIWEASFPSWDH